MRVIQIDAKKACNTSIEDFRGLAGGIEEATVAVTNCDALDLVLLNVLSPLGFAFGPLRPYDSERKSRSDLFEFLKGPARAEMSKWMRSNRISASVDSVKLLFGALVAAMHPGKPMTTSSIASRVAAYRIFGVWCTRNQYSWYLDRYADMERLLGARSFVRCPEGLRLEIDPFDESLPSRALIGGARRAAGNDSALRSLIVEQRDWLAQALESEDKLRRSMQDVPLSLQVSGTISFSNDLQDYSSDEGLAQEIRRLRLALVERLGLPHFGECVRHQARRVVANGWSNDPLAAEFQRVYSRIQARFPFVEAVRPLL